MPLPRVTLPALGSGPLTLHGFAAKDLIDVAGARKTSGNPDWARTHPIAERSAPVIDLLRSAGGFLVGKTVTDEIAFSLEGDNVHYGTPLNPRAPQSIPGGSSSGSASAVSSGLAHFALGTDTGGSVRVPSSFCGIFGMRPTHGRISLEGVTPLAPSFDTLGWMAPDGATLARVGDVLLGATGGAPIEPREFVIVRDAFSLMERPAEETLRESIRALLGDPSETTVFDGTPEVWSETYRVVQGGEAWAIHGPWIRSVHPSFAPPIAARFEDASRITAEQVERAREVRSALAARVEKLLAPGRALVVPSAPTVALPKDAGARSRLAGPFRRNALAIGAIAGHGGLPQVSLPIARLDGSPLGLGVIGSRGSDEALLSFAASARVRARTT